jgi:hypothetical protein
MFKRFITAVQSSHGDELTNMGFGEREQYMFFFPPQFVQLQGPIKGCPTLPEL